MNLLVTSVAHVLQALIFVNSGVDYQRFDTVAEVHNLRLVVSLFFMNTSAEVQQEDMYGMAEMPDLIPPSGALQPSPVIPYDHGRTQTNRSAPRGMLRAPKLGQIGRSKRVVIDDEDLDDIINNNRSFPVSQRVSPVA
ncbi:uncharacterized protein si:dkey-112a7.4 [Xyrauchen texanus]|uniref:uncharacterized protein si:dkey-112a7.4 n=1 Tax=Xyrauchen texanus TaxID=154827 RepID=UPI002242109E|nr:uncharacterized protein si:dkey-112a7.4 [Xyrauchen texanus]